MLHPSYTDLMKVVNKDVEEGETKIVNSRYSIVLATSKRARQIIDGELPMVNVRGEAKPLSLAIQELNEGKLKIIAENAGAEETEIEAEAEILTEEAANKTEGRLPVCFPQRKLRQKSCRRHTFRSRS